MAGRSFPRAAQVRPTPPGLGAPKKQANHHAGRPGPGAETAPGPSKAKGVFPFWRAVCENWEGPRSELKELFSVVAKPTVVCKMTETLENHSINIRDAGLLRE